MPQLRRGDLVIYDGYYAVVRDVTLTRVELRLANGLVIEAQDIIQQLDMRTGHRPLESVASFHEEMRPYDSWHYLKPEITHAITEELLTRAHRGIIATKLRDNSIKTQCKAGNTRSRLRCSHRTRPSVGRPLLRSRPARNESLLHRRNTPLRFRSAHARSGAPNTHALERSTASNPVVNNESHRTRAAVSSY
jgi:hypothetical protein